jgi:SAM-dependent methyltransferase
MKQPDIYESNRRAWNAEAETGNFWTVPVSQREIDDAREGKPFVRVTPFRSVPPGWISGLKGKRVLCACGGGGQQTPLLSAYGCHVTAVDISDAQTESDRLTLRKYGLEADLVRANVLGMPFSDHCFDAVIMPQAMNFIDDIPGLYREISRVLVPGGTFIFGIANPVLYIFDEKVQSRRLKVKYTLPFSHEKALSPQQLKARLDRNDTLEFSHTLDSVLGGLVSSGFVIDGFFTDSAGSEPTDSFIFDSHLAVKAVLAKPMK